MKGIKLVPVLVFLTITVFAAPHIASADTGTDVGTTYAAFQQYQNGYMVWRSDTGGVWVFGNNGWVATYYPESQYKDLPDNPISDTPPAGLIKPIRGLGRVWGNFSEVRLQLGWAVDQEKGYTASFESFGNTAGGLWQVAVTLPIRARLIIRQDGTWGYVGTPRPVDSLPTGSTMPASMQFFEYGYMLYWPETGSIWVLYFTGYTEFYDSAVYGALPENPVTATPPASRLKPIFGFGKVWGNIPHVRQGLGWATGPERSYVTTFNRMGAVSGQVDLAVQDPTGLTIVLRADNTWYIN